MGKRWGITVALVVIALLALVILATQQGKERGRTVGEEKMLVVATIYPLADWAKAVAGEKARVISLLPAGASPHTYEPTPAQVKEVSKARVCLMVGAGLDLWAEKLLSAATGPGTIKVVAAEGVPLIKEGNTHHEGAGHHHEGGNPHIWLDPVIAQTVVAKIAEALAEADPAGKGYYEKEAAAYQQELSQLDREIRETVSQFKRKEYIAFHPAWVYFSQRYGLKEVAVIEESPGKEPTPKKVEEIIRTLKKDRIKAVFAEPQFSPKTAEVIAEEAGVKVLFLDPLGGEGLAERENYLDLMRYNVRVMAEAMM